MSKVEWKKLGEVCSDVIVPMRDRPKQFDGSIPWCRIEDIEGMYFNKSLSGLMVSDEIIKKMNLKVFPTGTVICSCSATLGVCAINTQPLITNQTFIGLVCSKEVLNRYIYYYMSTRKRELLSLSTTGTIPYVSREKFEKMRIPVPTLSEQNRIVGILDTFTASIDNLKEQIAQRRKQYEYYRDQLLELEGKEGVEMKNVAHFVKERIPANKLTAQNYTSVENLLKNKAGRKDAENVPSEGNWIKYQKGDVLIGNIRPYLKKIWLSDREGGTNGDVIIIRANDVLIPKFMFYCLASDSFFLYYNQALKDGKMPRGEKNRVLSYVIPFFVKEKQASIVSILDTFEASIQNLEAQLAELEKQYEYYRNKLLTFE